MLTKLEIFRKLRSVFLSDITCPPRRAPQFAVRPDHRASRAVAREYPYQYEPRQEQKVALHNLLGQRVTRACSSRRMLLLNRHMATGMMVLILWSSPQLRAAQWPWRRPPDQVTAKCVVEPARVEQGAPIRLKAKVEAVDTRKHPLSYVWSGNGGKILGSGAAVEIDASRLNPGVYTVAAGVQDAYKNRADCKASFQVIFPANPLTVRCLIEPVEAPAGTVAQAKMEASDRLGQTLRYRWITNWGAKLPEQAKAQIQTSNMAPGEYSITGRVDDQWGHATDCRMALKILPPLPPPLPQELTNLAQIVFPFNGAQIGEPERKRLQKVVERIEHDPGGRISLESYAGPDEMNPEQLAAARAQAVKTLLLRGGIRKERVHTLVGLGGRLGGIRNRTLDVIWVPDGMDY